MVSIIFSNNLTIAKYLKQYEKMKTIHITCLICKQRCTVHTIARLWANSKKLSKVIHFQGSSRNILWNVLVIGYCDRSHNKSCVYTLISLYCISTMVSPLAQLFNFKALLLLQKQIFKLSCKTHNITRIKSFCEHTWTWILGPKHKKVPLCWQIYRHLVLLNSS